MSETNTRGKSKKQQLNNIQNGRSETFKVGYLLLHLWLFLKICFRHITERADSFVPSVASTVKC